MTTSLQEGPVILIGYEYRLQLQAEADLFPEGASFVGQVRSAITAATTLAELSTAAGSVLRVDDHTLEILLAPEVTANLLPGMVEAQRLRDAAMAAAALEALADFGPPVVIITGSGHARTDVGIPAMIRAARPDVSLWSLGQLEADPGPGAPYDAIHVTDPTPRDDPCAAFQ
jgi:hypothetical protein